MRDDAGSACIRSAQLRVAVPVTTQGERNQQRGDDEHRASALREPLPPTSHTIGCIDAHQRCQARGCIRRQVAATCCDVSHDVWEVHRAPKPVPLYGVLLQGQADVFVAETVMREVLAPLGGKGPAT